MAYVDVDESFGARLRAQWEHHASTVLMVLTVAVVAVGLVPQPGILSLYVPLALVTLVLVTYALMRAHDRKFLCEQCLMDMPLNPAKDAHRLRRRLWLLHTVAEPRFMVLYVALLVGSNFFPGSIGRYAWAAVQLVSIYLLLAVRSHRRLQPWCQWSDRAAARRRFRKRRHSCTPAPRETQPA